VRRELVIAAALLAACSGGDDASRQDQVADRGAEVMPFDLEATTHRFEPTDTGLLETVVADDPTDAEQVGLIRQHLAEEADRFVQGDYGDPATIHGQDMPGLSELEAGADDITVTLADLPDGATLTFTTEDPALVDALHRWGEAQVSDHGQHAEG
jgi:hypothetical protein